MKSLLDEVGRKQAWSPLAMAEWIEITAFPTALIPFLSPLAMAEWIEISRISKPKLH